MPTPPSTPFQAVLILRGQQGPAAAEACAMLDITEGNMRMLLHRACFAVRAALARAITLRSVASAAR